MPDARASLALLLLANWLAVDGVPSVASTGAPTVVKTYENDTVLLPCHVEDLGLQTRVRWYRDNKLLADSDNSSVAGANPRLKMWDNRSLELVQVRPDDSGEYRCQATRPEPWGHVTQVHEIQVMYPASAKPIPESGQLEVDLNDEATMACAAEGVPKPQLSWSFQGEELPSGGERLRVRASNRSLAGVYTCEASNGVGEPARAGIELKIRHKPEVRVASRWVHSAPGVRSQLECLVVAWPEARVSWHFDGEPLAKSSNLLRYKQDASSPELGGSAQLHTLLVRNVRDQLLGRYACNASNALGSASASAELSGLPKPPLLKREARSGSSCNFIWEVDSYSPIVEYQFWFRQMDTREEWRRLVIPSRREASAGPLHAHSFNLTGLQPARQYEALVLARNRFGLSSPSKIVRFATANGHSTEEKAYEVNGNGHEQIPPAVQVTSDSHRSSDTSSSDRAHINFLTPLLPLVILLSGKLIDIPD